MSDFNRQHPLMIINTFLNQLRNLIVPFLVIFFINFQADDTNWRSILLGALAILVLTLFHGFLRWFFYRYRFESGTLIIKSGIIIKHRRTIKRERVQTTNTHAGPLLRVFNLVKLTIETAGSKGEAEFELEALKKAEAQQLMDLLSGESEETHEEEKSDATFPKYVFAFKTLFIAGLTSGGVGIIFTLLSVAVSQIISLAPEVGEWMLDTIIGTSIILLVVLFVVVIFVSWVISTLRFLVRYAFFTIERRDDELIIEHGLIARKRFTLKIYRIQAVSVVEGVLRQPFNYATVELTTAGASGYDKSFRVIALPLIYRQDIQKFMRTFLPEYNVNFKLKSLPKKSWRRYLFRASVYFLLVLPLYFITPYAYLLFLLLPFSLILGHFRFKDAGYYIDDDVMIYRFRYLARTTAIVQKPHIQSLQFDKNPLQRLRNLTHISMHVMAAPSRVTFTLKDIDNSQTMSLYRWFSRQNVLK